MLAELKWKTLQELVSGSTKEELIWINGYLAGLVAQSSASPVAETPSASAVKVNKITLTYGTETGNAKKLATTFAGVAKKKGIQVKLAGLDQYRVNDLSKEEYFFSVVSTQGDGEPPAAAIKFFDHLRSSDKTYQQLKYGILALGDTSYPLFCQAGEEIDQLFEKKGASRILPIVKCDTDYEAEAAQWFEQVLKTLENGNGAAQPAPVPVKAKSGKKQYTGTIATNVDLNDRGSSKETHHIEIVCDEEIVYQPGDAAGFVPHNKGEEVQAILDITGCAGTEQVQFKNESWELRALLTKKTSIIHLPERVVKKYAALAQQDIPETKIDLLNLLKIYPLADSVPVQQLVDILEPITPRLYSIASSPNAHSGELHLTVARNTYVVNDEIHYGFCSTFLNGLAENAEVEFYIHPNNHFRLPAPDKDVIMIGPGTGIAPFRSFLAERDSTGATGRNWLFFGEQHFVSDFLYQTELQDFFNTGVLTNIDLAFSRDQEAKIYVQHRMKEKAAELYDWLKNGASVYVCGAKEPMSVDVESTLLEIIAEQGNLTEEKAAQYLEQLSNEGRYLKDVY